MGETKRRKRGTKMIKFEGMHQQVDSKRTLFTYSADMSSILSENASRIVENIHEMAAQHIAEEFIKQNAQELMKKLDHQAIFNLAMAKSAAKVFDEVKK